jgi:hypothetical protein
MKINLVGNYRVCIFAYQITKKLKNMNLETKIYSDFIKKNKIVVSKDYFVYNIMIKPTIVPICKDDDGKWYADNDDKCHTKKAAIYWYLKNNTDFN